MLNATTNISLSTFHLHISSRILWTLYIYNLYFSSLICNTYRVSVLYCYRVKQWNECVFTQTDRRHHNIMACIPVWQNITLLLQYLCTWQMLHIDKQKKTNSSSVHDYLNTFVLDKSWMSCFHHAHIFLCFNVFSQNLFKSLVITVQARKNNLKVGVCPTKGHITSECNNVTPSNFVKKLFSVGN